MSSRHCPQRRQKKSSVHASYIRGGQCFENEERHHVFKALSNTEAEDILCVQRKQCQLLAGVFNSLTCKCASHHSGVEFFDIKPPKSSPYPSFFPHFDLQICFAPQRRAIFEHRNFQNGSYTLNFLTFRLTNMLRATAALHFSTAQLPKWLRECGVLCILTCKCASRHSGVQFLNIATSKMAPPMWCFVHFDLQMCFSPQPRAIFHLSAEQLPPHPPL